MTSASSKAQPRIYHGATPIASMGDRHTLRASSGSSGVGSASLSANTLPAYTGSWLVTEVMEVQAWDTATVEIFYNGHASSTTGYAQVIPWGSNIPTLTDINQVSPPLLTDDVWFMLPTIDGTLTTTAISGTVGVGSASNGTIAGAQKIYGQIITCPAVTSGSNFVRQSASIKVRGIRFLTFACAERGDNTNPGKLNLHICGII